jgi:hypothetical protein
VRDLRIEHHQIGLEIEKLIEKSEIGSSIQPIVDSPHSSAGRSPEEYILTYYDDIDEDAYVSNRSSKTYSITSSGGHILAISTVGLCSHGDKFGHPAWYYFIVGLTGLDESP